MCRVAASRAVVVRSRLHRGADDLFDRGAQPWRIEPLVDFVAGEAHAPLADGHRRQSPLPGHRLVVLARHAAAGRDRRARDSRCCHSATGSTPLGVPDACLLLERRGGGTCG